MLRIPKILSDGCVLQQGTCRIWGWCAPMEQVRVSVGKTADACVTAGQDGRFEAELSIQQPGGPYELRIATASGEERTIRVYVGDVFVCAGQSNMELPMNRVRVRFPEEFRNGGADCVHIYKVAECFDFCTCREDHANAAWSACTREHLSEASAFSYFFGKELAARRGVPIGIINLSLGGTPAEAWMSWEGLKDFPALLRLADRHQSDAFCSGLLAEQAKKEEAWYRGIELLESESGDAPFVPGAVLPGTLAQWGLPGFCGILWLRRTFQVPRECEKRAALLRLGTLIDSDTVYVNGVRVGDTPYRYPPRRYPIPEGLLRAGENVIEIRLVCREGDGRITQDKPLDIIWEDVCSDAWTPGADVQPDAIPLSGAWEYQVRASCGPAPEQIFLNRVPAGLFQGMVAPCLPYRVKGAVWYQGESNDRSPKEYEAVLAGMIRDWRNCWRQESLPFVIVQLPNCDVDVATGDAWPQIREAQRRAASLPDVAVTVNLDLGEDNDLHPLNKKTAAERAAQAVRALVYREDAAWRGPVLESWRTENGRMYLQFRTECGSLALKRCDARCSKKENPRLFELAGRDGIFHPASAALKGTELVLQSGEVREPCRARYAWDRAPGAELLYDEGGNCASPFVTE